MTQPTKVLNDGFVQLIDHMGSDSSVCNAARVSYGNHNNPLLNEYEVAGCKLCSGLGYTRGGPGSDTERKCTCLLELEKKQQTKNRNLIRYLMRHRHTTPFEMVSFVFLVRAPIHVARQWFRHRTWSYNEYSTRYKPAINSFETTEMCHWRTQAKDNKQGSSGFIPESEPMADTDGKRLSREETSILAKIKNIYQKRLKAGVAREQARKDLPLSTYTEFYAKTDLHNLFHFLSLRKDSHAQLEIRSYANAISDIIKPIVPNSYEAFEDYRLNGASFSSQEVELLKDTVKSYDNSSHGEFLARKPDTLSDREWSEFKEKLGN